MLAVQIVVSYLVPGPLGAMLGNFAGQVVGNVLGIQDGISWKEVAKAGLSSFIGGQLGAEGSPLAGSDLPTVVARAAISNAITQGVSVAVGLQEKFDWRGVAAAAVSAGVSHAVGEAIGQAQHGDDWDLAKQNPLSNPDAIAAKYAISQDLGGNLLRGAISGFAGGVAKQLVYGGKMNFASIAVDAFGNALGDALGQYITGPDVKAEQLAALEKAQKDAWLGSGLNPGAGGIRLKPTGGIGFKAPEGYVFGPQFRSESPYLSWTRPNYGLVDDEKSAPRLNAINGVGPIQIQAGTAAAQGFWGVAREQLGPGATNAEIQDYAQRLMSANPGVRFDRMRADTPLTLPDANTSVTDQARGEWARSNVLAAAREQARIEAAQVATDNPVPRSGGLLVDPETGLPSFAYSSRISRMRTEAANQAAPNAQYAFPNSPSLTVGDHFSPTPAEHPREYVIARSGAGMLGSSAGIVQGLAALGIGTGLSATPAAPVGWAVNAWGVFHIGKNLADFTLNAANLWKAVTGSGDYLEDSVFEQIVESSGGSQTAKQWAAAGNLTYDLGTNLGTRLIRFSTGHTFDYGKAALLQTPMKASMETQVALKYGSIPSTINNISNSTYPLSWFADINENVLNPFGYDITPEYRR